jgi:flagellar L-ring protein precursor FlgH
MMNKPSLAALLAAALAATALWLAAADAAAQSSSLWGNPATRAPLDPYKQWTFEQAEETQTIHLHDIITVVISETAQVNSHGKMDRQKQAHEDLLLKNWVLFKGLAMVPDPQTAGPPHVRGEVDNKMQSEATLDTKDVMKFRIACNVVDIRPNGNLIIEGRREIHNNEEIWDYSLTGEIRAKDVLPNNTVQSENVAELKLNKSEVGHVSDGYRRGWLLKWLDAVQPF